MEVNGRSGHRVASHTTNMTLDAWATTRAGCVAEVVRGVVESFADTDRVAATQPVQVSFDDDNDAGLLIEALEEVIYLLDVMGSVVVAVELADTDSGGITGFFEIASLDHAGRIGPAPRAVNRHGVFIGRQLDEWTARVTMDV